MPRALTSPSRGSRDDTVRQSRGATRPALQRRLGNRATARQLSAAAVGVADRRSALMVRQAGIGNHATARILSRKYESERYEPALDDAPFQLVFTGDQLTKRGSGSPGAWSAVSGKAAPAEDYGGAYGGAGFGGDNHVEFDYSGEAQKAHDRGPIPEGMYWLDPTELHDMRLWHHVPNPAYLIESSGWGTHRITIHPHISTQTYGRGGFFIHGGASPGSIGCIDLWNHMEDFVPVIDGEAERAQRAVEDGSAQRDTKIELTVDYSRYRNADHLYRL